MKKLLHEWRLYIEEMSKSEAKWWGPAFVELTENPRLAVDDDWLDREIGPILGTGYSREVREIKDHPEFVFKAAKSLQLEDGSFTNAVEKKYFNKYPEFFPRTWLSAPEGIGYSPKGMEGAFDFIPWVVVDKVEIVYEWDEYESLVRKVFPALQFVVDYMDHKKIVPMSYTNFSSRTQLARVVLDMFMTSTERDFRFWYKSAYMKSVLVNNGDINLGMIRNMQKVTELWGLLHEVETEPEEFASTIYETLLKDYKLSQLRRLVGEAGVEFGDIRPSNVGTDVDEHGEAAGNKFIIIDIGVFLNSAIRKKRGQLAKNIKKVTNSDPHYSPYGGRNSSSSQTQKPRTLNPEPIDRMSSMIKNLVKKVER